jgi:hypothetical protein
MLDGVSQKLVKCCQPSCSSSELTEVAGRQLCDPEADVRASELEWPFWVDSSLSV